MTITDQRDLTYPIRSLLVIVRMLSQDVTIVVIDTSRKSPAGGDDNIHHRNKLMRDSENSAGAAGLMRARASPSQS